MAAGDDAWIRGWLERLTDAHVECHRGGARQGTPEWLAAKGLKVGGSELSTLKGWNPYESWEKLIGKKLGVLSRGEMEVPCWWGTMFEPVTERLVELDCQASVRGTDIHIRPPDLLFHANSPDGYCVLAFEEAEDGWVLSHDPAAAAAAGIEVHYLPALIELKAPYRRLPGAKPPKYYLPQVWSGLALSPHALIGVFIEAVYRVCSLTELGPGGGYSAAYHGGDKRRGEPWPLPLAWGATAVYAPRWDTRAARLARVRSDASAAQRAKIADADMICYMILGRDLGVVLAADELGSQQVDLGEVAAASPRDFDRVMELIDLKATPVRHSEPVFAEGAASDPATLTAFFNQAEAAAPEGFYLFGFIPWKVFDLGYHLVGHQPGFREEIDELTTRFMGELNALRAAPDPIRAYYDYCAARKAPAPAAQKAGLDAVFAQAAAAFAD